METNVFTGRFTFEQRECNTENVEVRGNYYNQGRSRLLSMEVLEPHCVSLFPCHIIELRR